MRFICSLLLVLLFPFLANGQTLPAIDNYFLTLPVPILNDKFSVAQKFMDDMNKSGRVDFQNGVLEEPFAVGYITGSQLANFDPAKDQALKAIKVSAENILYPVTDGKKIINSINISCKKGQWEVWGWGDSRGELYSSLRKKAVRTTGLKASAFFILKLPLNREALAYKDKNELMLFDLQDEIQGKPLKARPAKEVFKELQDIANRRPPTK